MTREGVGGRTDEADRRPGLVPGYLCVTVGALRRHRCPGNHPDQAVPDTRSIRGRIGDVTGLGPRNRSGSERHF